MKSAAQMTLFDVPTAQYESYVREIEAVMFAPVCASKRICKVRDRMHVRDEMVRCLRDAAESRRNHRLVKALDRLTVPTSVVELDEQIAGLEEIDVRTAQGVN